MSKLKAYKKTNSQAGQDMFVLNSTGNKLNGFYVEIGSSYPILGNNTYLLETDYEWKGVSLEIQEHIAKDFQKMRRNPCVNTDATAFNFEEYFIANNYPEQIDYLQIDIDPARANLSVLRNIPLDRYRFSVITFEHDLYRNQENREVKRISEEILQSYGYAKFADNVQIVSPVKESTGKWEPFEDWWVDPRFCEIDKKFYTVFNVKFVDIFDYNLKFKFHLQLEILKIKIKVKEDNKLVKSLIFFYRFMFKHHKKYNT